MPQAYMPIRQYDSLNSEPTNVCILIERKWYGVAGIECCLDMGVPDSLRTHCTLIALILTRSILRSTPSAASISASAPNESKCPKERVAKMARNANVTIQDVHIICALSVDLELMKMYWAAQIKSLDSRPVAPNAIQRKDMNRTSSTRRACDSLFLTWPSLWTSKKSSNFVLNIQIR